MRGATAGVRSRTLVPLAVLLALAGVSPAARADEVSLTGTWRSDDDCPGTFYVRQVGKTVWWMGKSQDDGRSWTNVFRGTLKDDVLTGEWADVPQGANTGSGTLTLHLVVRGGRVVEIRKRRQVGDEFGVSVWRRQP